MPPVVTHAPPVVRKAELGLAESTLATQTTSSTTPVDATGLSVTVVVTDRPIVIEAACSCRHAAVGGIVVLQLVQGASTVVQVAQATSAVANALNQIPIKRRLSLAPGSYTFKLQFGTSAFGTAGVSTIAAGATSPNWLHVYEV